MEPHISVDGSVVLCPSVCTAAREGDLRRLTGRLSRGAFADAFTSDGQTALCLAVKHGHVECVAALLEAGATVALPENSGAMGAGADDA